MESAQHYVRCTRRSSIYIYIGTYMYQLSSTYMLCYDLRLSIFFTFDRQTAIIRKTRQYIIYRFMYYTCECMMCSDFECPRWNGGGVIKTGKYNKRYYQLLLCSVIYTQPSRDGYLNIYNTTDVRRGIKKIKKERIEKEKTTTKIILV